MSNLPEADFSTFSPVNSIVPFPVSNHPEKLPKPTRHRVLFISYAFPPTGGGGVQRSVKFTRYLTKFGWQPTVLTVLNPSVPVKDQHLASQIGPATKILRAKTFEPGYGVKQALSNQGQSSAWSWRRSVRSLAMQILQPDPQVLWNPRAYRLAARHLSQHLHDAIVVTGPPFSSFLLGCKLKRRFGLPLVLDFRDEWLLSMTKLDNYRVGAFATQIQKRMLRSVLRTADGVIATTERSSDYLRQQCQQAGSRAVVQRIYNGFDPIDLPSQRTSSGTDGRLRVVYTGTLWNLTDIQPLIDAILTLEATDPKSVSNLELLLVGRRTVEQQQKLKSLQRTSLKLKCFDYLDHDRSLQIAADGDVLLLLLSDDDGAERVVPAKLFEYLALKKPILGICPDGEAADLLRANGNHAVYRPRQSEQIGSWLQLQSNASQRSSLSSTDSLDGTLSQFERGHLTGQLASLLDRLTRHSD